MASYDYISGKKRIKEILDNKLEVIESSKIPKDDNFTFSNAYYGWVTGIFVDIRDSTSLFSQEDKELVSKMIRSFTSEIIEILRDDENIREIGIRGDCVYAVYTTDKKDKIVDVYDKGCMINTFMKMLNKLLTKKGLGNIKIGIGISSSQELVIKAGRKGFGINNSVWIGDAVTKASNLSSLGNKNDYKTIVISHSTYFNIIDRLIKDYGNDAKAWFKKRNHDDFGTIYDGSVVMISFNEWIENGMKEN